MIIKMSMCKLSMKFLKLGICGCWLMSLRQLEADNEKYFKVLDWASKMKINECM